MTCDIQTGMTQLYVDHKSWLTVFLKKRLKCSHQAADTLQDTYLKILVSGKLPPPEYTRQYLSRVAKGLVVDYYRRWKIEQTYLESLQLLPQASESSPEHRLEILETLVEIDALLHHLSAKARQAFLLRRLEGLSYQMIAEQMEVSVSSVEKYVAKGLQACALAMMDFSFER